jgi:hypothetical protein
MIEIKKKKLNLKECIKMNEKELRRLQVLEVVYNMLIEEDSLLEKLNDMYEFEVGEKINITKEELMEVVEDCKKL